MEEIRLRKKANLSSFALIEIPRMMITKWEWLFWTKCPECGENRRFTQAQPPDQLTASAPKASSSVPSKVPSAPAAASTYLLENTDIVAILPHTYVGRVLTWTSRPVDAGFAFMIRPATNANLSTEYTRRNVPRTPRALRDLLERISSFL